jgi:hypothetical protein
MTGLTNINGASLIKVNNTYLLYFSSHKGINIYLAYSQEIDKNYIFYGSVLHIEDTPCFDHIASPDVHIEDNHVVMYYHGMTESGQKTFKATSRSATSFISQDVPITPYYHREFKYKDDVFAICKNGNTDSIMYQKFDNKYIKLFHFLKGARHTTILADEDISIYYTVVGEAPERVYVTDLQGNGGEVLRPLYEWEGANKHLVRSKYGGINCLVNQLRDPFIYKENNQLYLLYSYGGESGIAITKIENNV